jgi:hypothetical protein
MQLLAKFNVSDFAYVIEIHGILLNTWLTLLRMLEYLSF